MNYIFKLLFTVGGNMNTEDAGKVGKMLAKTAFIAAILFGSAALLAAASLWK